MQAPSIAWFALWVYVVCAVQHVQAGNGRRHDKRARHGRRHMQPANHEPTQTALPTTTTQSALSAIIHEQVRGQNPTQEEEYYYYYNNEPVGGNNDTVQGAPQTSHMSIEHVDALSRKALAEQYKSRLRAKQIRMMAIRSSIIRGLGMESQPNITGKHLSQEDAMAMTKFFHSTEEEEATNRAYRYQFAKPSCDLPPKTHKTWRDPEHFRLYFTPKSLDSETDHLPDFKMSEALLRLYKKGPLEHDECDCPKTSNNIKLDRNDVIRKNKQKNSHRSGKGSKANRNTRKKNSSKHHRPARIDHDSQLKDEGDNHELRVTISWFQKPIKKNRRIKKQIKISKMVARDYIGWIEIDIKSLVLQWIHKPKKNFGIEVVVEDDQQVALDPFNVFDNVNCSKTGEASDGIYLNLSNLEEGQLLNETFYESGFNLTLPNLEMSYAEMPTMIGRRKRDASKTCVMESIFVSFQELGLGDRILAPQGLEAIYCKGHCLPMASREHYDMENDLKNDSNAYKACCGPTKFRPFRFLHYSDSGTLSVSSVDNFIVAECGCRK